MPKTERRQPGRLLPFFLFLFRYLPPFKNQAKGGLFHMKQKEIKPLDPMDLYIRQVRLKEKPSGLEDYITALPLIRQLEALKLDRPVTFLVGENGSGKSTLLEAIALAAGFNAEGGSRNFRFATQNTHSQLYRNLILVRGAKRPRDGYFLRAESFYNLASEIDRMDSELPGLTESYGGRSLHRQSHGESFLSLMLNRFGGQGLYLLDEPEAALSPSRQLSALVAFQWLVEHQSQLIIATHSPILMAYPEARIFQLDEQGLGQVEYRQTEHYQLTRRFLENPEKMLHYLLS